MPHTQGNWTQATPFGDGELFIGADQFKDILSNAVLATASQGDLQQSIAASKACTFFASISQMLRIGVFATPAGTQRQFGTAASQPGPSTVSGTSSPLGLPSNPGFPPWTAAVNPTTAGSVAGPTPKGIQVNWIDIIYSVAAVNLSVCQMGFSRTVYQNGVAPTITNTIALGNNGLSKVVAAQPYRTRVTVPNPVFIKVDGTEMVLQVNITTPAGGTANFTGAIVGITFNYN